MGRQTEYKETYIDKCREYLDKCKDELDIVMSQEVTNVKEINWTTGVSETKTTKVWLKNIKIPSIEWLAKYINVSRSTIYKWRDEQKDFSDILEEILEEQAIRLINMGLSWRYNPTITKLMLTKHWYVDKEETKSEWTIEFIIKQ